MSGPKKSHWEIIQERQEIIRKEREHARSLQIYEIKTGIVKCQKDMKTIINQHGKHADYINRRVEEWIADVELNCKYDLRIAFGGLRGIQEYLLKQRNLLHQRAVAKQIAEDKAMAEEKKRQEDELLLKERVNRIMEYFISVKANYPHLINAGVEQRISLYTQSLLTNPDNPQTIKQVMEFKEIFKEKVDQFEEQQAHNEYLKTILIDVLGGEEKPGSEGESTILGSFDNVPITFHINSGGYEFRMDTPDDVSCKKGISALRKKLTENHISLGPVQIMKTGEVLNRIADVQTNTAKTKA